MSGPVVTALRLHLPERDGVSGVADVDRDARRKWLRTCAQELQSAASDSRGPYVAIPNLDVKALGAALELEMQ